MQGGAQRIPLGVAVPAEDVVARLDRGHVGIVQTEDAVAVLVDRRKRRLAIAHCRQRTREVAAAIEAGGIPAAGHLPAQVPERPLGRAAGIRVAPGARDAHVVGGILIVAEEIVALDHPLVLGHPLARLFAAAHDEPAVWHGREAPGVALARAQTLMAGMLSAREAIRQRPVEVNAFLEEEALVLERRGDDRLAQVRDVRVDVGALPHVRESREMSRRADREAWLAEDERVQVNGNQEGVSGHLQSIVLNRVPRLSSHRARRALRRSSPSPLIARYFDLSHYVPLIRVWVLVRKRQFGFFVLGKFSRVASLETPRLFPFGLVVIGIEI